MLWGGALLPLPDHAEDREGVLSVHGAEREAVRMKTTHSPASPRAVDRGGYHPLGVGAGEGARPLPAQAVPGYDRLTGESPSLLKPEAFS